MRTVEVENPEMLRDERREHELKQSILNAAKGLQTVLS